MDGGAATYAYDGEGRRMKKTTSAETTYTFYGPGGILCEFSTVNTGATAAASTDRTLYRTSERTGTAVLLFTTAGTVIENNRTLPYGEAWLSDVASANDKKFTTYDRDKESGLDYAMARMYANTGGRFTSPDQGPIHTRMPSTLNRYVYGGLDPINNIDPSGNDFLGDEWTAVYEWMMEGDQRCLYTSVQGYSRACPGYADPVAQGLLGYELALQNTYDAIDANADYQAGLCALEECLARNPTLVAVSGGPTGQTPGGTGGQGSGGSGGFWSAVGNILGYIWNGPNTALGVGYGLIGIPTQGIGVQYGQLQFRGNLLQWLLSFGGNGAITLGDAGIYPRGFGPDSINPNTGQPIGLEESFHSRQGRVLGPLYLPANGVGGAAGLIRDGDWHGPANFMERGPHQRPPRRF